MKRKEKKEINKHDEYVELFKNLKSERDQKIEMIVSSLLSLYLTQLKQSIIKDFSQSIKIYTIYELNEFIKKEFQVELSSVEVKSIYAEVNTILTSTKFGFKIREPNVGSPELYIDIK